MDELHIEIGYTVLNSNSNTTSQHIRKETKNTATALLTSLTCTVPPPEQSQPHNHGSFEITHALYQLGIMMFLLQWVLCPLCHHCSMDLQQLQCVSRKLNTNKPISISNNNNRQLISNTINIELLLLIAMVVKMSKMNYGLKLDVRS